MVEPEECLFLQSILNADCPLESSSCFQSTKISTFIQHFPVRQEKELEPLFHCIIEYNNLLFFRGVAKKYEY